MLEKNVIESSDSDFLNPLVVVKNKTGDIRVCLDMRNLNNITKKNTAANADTLYIKYQSEKYMTRLDLTNSFWQIPLDEDSQKCTTFLSRCIFLVYQLFISKKIKITNLKLYHLDS